MKTVKPQPADCIVPLTINGLRGRKMLVPAAKKPVKREILLLYGLHASLERIFGVAELLATYGDVTVPDLPGFGGMDSFYKIGKAPDLDNMADYLATFIKLTYKNRPITVGAMSYGFVIITKMFQKYPELIDQVDYLISIVGFTSSKDFRLSKRTMFILRKSSAVVKNPVLSAFAKYIVLRGPFIAATYRLIADKHVKMKDADNAERKRRIKFEIYLWKCNDVRTYMASSSIILNLDITKNKVKMPVAHIGVDHDQYFNNRSVKTNLNKVYRQVKIYNAKMANHAPTVIGDADSVKELFPKEIKRILATAPR